MRTTLILWDIDHTLLVSGPAGASVYPRAFTELTGARPALTVPIEGRTELEIMHELLAVHQITGVSDAQASDAMTRALRSALTELLAHGRRLPGALEVLTAFHHDPRVVQSLLTGNLRANAEVKLRAFELDGLVDFEAGAYGSDDAVRSRLVAHAQRRAGRRYEGTFDRRNTVLIGDTTRDMAAGRAGGARTVGVATGPDSAQDLLAAGAEAVLTDLRNAVDVIAAFLGDGRQHAPRS
jgi:phosphoglycolate phosphatase